MLNCMLAFFTLKYLISSSRSSTILLSAAPFTTLGIKAYQFVQQGE